ncbi:response regulator [Coprobacter tertius]|uniref:Response regulator n=1 Tax=Coprobacter tertius TaxID=2944915 RepID=A0ABT1MIQ1_9BACT|nr:response regulator [Coprobacter tertius]MCP9612316.1 response regulator [Coprobacter tertius]
MNETTILIIDDEVQIRRLLTITLEMKGYKVYVASNAREGMAATAMYSPTLIILDLGLPDEDGHNVLSKLREWYYNPIIILSARTNEEEIIKALDHGANDYLTKPFHNGELLARIRSAMRMIKNNNEPSPVMDFGDLHINIHTRTVKKGEEILKLTTTEYSILTLMAQNAGKVLTHQYILKQVWGVAYQDQPQYLRVFIAQLRKKIEDDPSFPEYITTESGIGYRFCDEK